MTVCRRCGWKPDLDEPLTAKQQLDVHLWEAAHPRCVVCRHVLTLVDPKLACESCLTRTREDLSGIVTLWADLPRHLGHARVQRYDSGPRSAEEHQLPGGTVLVLLAPGGTGTAARRLTPTDISHGLTGREHGVDNQPGDTPSVEQVLAGWEDDWRHTRGEPAAMADPTGVRWWVRGAQGPLTYGQVLELAAERASTTARVVRGASRYLEVHARWAANEHEAFGEFAGDLRELHDRLQMASGVVRRPVKAGADCFDCGGTLVRPVNEQGMEVEDLVECRRCGSSYDGQRYLLALAARRQAGLDGWVSVPAAALAAKRPVKTLRAWLGRHVPWALRIEPREPTAEDPSRWRTVEHLAWYPALAERAERAQRRRTSRSA